MDLFNFFKKEKNKIPCNLAKERLQILIAHEHADQSKKSPDYLPSYVMTIVQMIP